jgi:hypothetical protein
MGEQGAMRLGIFSATRLTRNWRIIHAVFDETGPTAPHAFAIGEVCNVRRSGI